MNNITDPKNRKFNGKHYLKIKKIVTAPRKIIRIKLRGFLPLNLETFIETLPNSEPITRRRPGLNPGI